MPLQRKRGFYEAVIKRILDIVCALLTVLIFGWLYLILALLVRIKMGSPVLFRQPRPGLIDPKTGKEKIFLLCKFRTMTEKCDENGALLPDDLRLGAFGRWLRASSLDELPEVFNILKGEMSVIGPRPQLVRDMVFMTDAQRMRHTARPGLSGLAQVMGRNAISWEEKLDWDLVYLRKVTFAGDLKIVWMTFRKVFFPKTGDNSSEETDVASDYGDELLRQGKITLAEYQKKQNEAKALLERGRS